ncbi:hypothetical protein BJY04DRAFT_178568 [Aspergillus karnatakaensis]|uniref:uncharacterized protein n=1 Tax=Aspergillus karnatakaensis TaxID=1810916 RepID=UPI003CCE132D
MHNPRTWGAESRSPLLSPLSSPCILLTHNHSPYHYSTGLLRQSPTILALSTGRFLSTLGQLSQRTTMSDQRDAAGDRTADPHGSTSAMGKRRLSDLDDGECLFQSEFSRKSRCIREGIQQGDMADTGPSNSQRQLRRRSDPLQNNARRTDTTASATDPKTTPSDPFNITQHSLPHPELVILNEEDTDSDAISESESIFSDRTSSTQTESQPRASLRPTEMIVINGPWTPPDFPEANDTANELLQRFDFDTFLHADLEQFNITSEQELFELCSDRGHRSVNLPS